MCWPAGVLRPHSALTSALAQNVYTERAVRFLAAFTAARQAGRKAEGDLFVEDLLSYLLSLAQARASPCPDILGHIALTDIRTRRWEVTITVCVR